MNKLKQGIVLIILFSIFSFIYYQNSIITNKEEKISAIYELLDDTHKYIVKSKSDASRQAEIEKVIIRSSNKRYTGVNKAYYGKTVYKVTVPINDGAETELLILSNLELTELVGYGVRE